MVSEESSGGTGNVRTRPSQPPIPNRDRAGIAVVLADGWLAEPETIRRRLATASVRWVVAADGGARFAERLGLELGVVVGDMDSLPREVAAEMADAGVEFHRVSRAKDETDLELALMHAAEKGIDGVVVLGALGDRLDMSVANVLLLAHASLLGLPIELWHAAQTAWLVRPPGGSLRPPLSGGARGALVPGDRLSLLPLAGDAVMVESRGLRYPLTGEDLLSGPARGISNVVSHAEAHVALRSGVLLAVHEPAADADEPEPPGPAGAPGR